MNSQKISKDPNYRRAMMLLNRKIDTPEYLFTLWKMLPKPLVAVPPPEKVSPWYSGLEKMLK